MELSRKDNTINFLKWTKKRNDLWRILYTPDCKEMTPEKMRMIIEELLNEELYELIFVMLTIHRNTPFVSDVLSMMFNDLTSSRWKNEKVYIIKRILHYLP